MYNNQNEKDMSVRNNTVWGISIWRLEPEIRGRWDLNSELWVSVFPCSTKKKDWLYGSRWVCCQLSSSKPLLAGLTSLNSLSECIIVPSAKYTQYKIKKHSRQTVLSVTFGTRHDFSDSVLLHYAEA
jgi:hypothetical protein